MAMRLYGILWRWHFLAGMIAAPVIFIVAITGIAYAFEPELSRTFFERSRLEVPPQARKAPLEDVLALATSPACTPVGMYIPSARDRATVVHCDEGERRRVLVDPYRSVRVEQLEGENVLDLALDLHWELMADEWGRRCVEWATSWMILLFASGAVLWWPRGKRRGGGVWWIRRGRKRRELLRDLHAVGGFYALPVVLAIAATGLMWTLHAGEERWHRAASDVVDATRAARPTSPPPSAGAERVTVDRALIATGFDRDRDGRAVFFILPRRPDAPFSFLLYDDTQTTPWVTETVFVDAYDGHVLRRLQFSDRSFLGKVDSLKYSIHTGSILGLAGRILACVMSALLAALCVTGPWMWWRRRPRGKLGVPPRARRVPWTLLVVLALLGWLLPTVGWTLLAVLAVELVRVLVRLVRMRRSARIALLVVGLASMPRIAHADIEPFDADGDGDIDDEDRQILEAAEQIEVVDVSDGRRAVESARAVTVIDTKVARERTADLGEVLSRAQGIQVRRFGGLGAPARFSLEGLSDDQVRFFLDGLPLELVGFGLGVANVPIELVQRIEVHRGVVPIALGADALGGAVDLITDPSWVNRGAASYQLGSYGTHRATASARARDADTGLALGLALSFDRARNDYLVDVDIPDDTGRPQPRRVPRFHDGYVAGIANVEAGLVDRGALRRALVRVFATRYSKDLQHDLLMKVPYGEATYGETARGATGDLQLASGPWSLRLAGGVVQRWIDFQDVGLAIYDWNGDVIGPRRKPGELGTATNQRVRQRAAFLRLVAERAFGEHVVRVAVAPTLIRRTGSDFTDSDPSTPNALSAPRDLAQLVVGGEYEVRALQRRLENIAFAKLYASRLSAEQLEPGFMFRDVNRSFVRFGLGEAARWKLSPQLAAKASYEWALRVPSVDEVFGNGVLIGANLELAPERSHNLNVGLRYDGEGRYGELGAEVSGFARLADQLIVLPPGDKSVTYKNVTAARILGVESSARWQTPARWLTLDGSLTLQDLRNVSSTGSFGMFDGDRLPNRPWWLGGFGATVSARSLWRTNDELAGFTQSRFVHEFYRNWESIGTADSKQTIPTQLVHSIGATYAMRGASALVFTLELQNLTGARVYDSYGVQRPGRMLSAKLSAEL